MCGGNKFSDNYVYKLRAENESLLAELDQLKRSLSPDKESQDQVVLQKELGLTTFQSLLVFKMLSRAVMTHSEIDALMARETPGSSENVARARVLITRKRLNKFGIDINTVRGVGYELPEGSKKTIREILVRNKTSKAA